MTGMFGPQMAVTIMLPEKAAAPALVGQATSKGLSLESTPEMSPDDNPPTDELHPAPQGNAYDAWRSSTLIVAARGMRVGVARTFAGDASAIPAATGRSKTASRRRPDSARARCRRA